MSATQQGGHVLPGCSAVDLCLSPLVCTCMLFSERTCSRLSSSCQLLIFVHLPGEQELTGQRPPNQTMYSALSKQNLRKCGLAHHRQRTPSHHFVDTNTLQIDTFNDIYTYMYPEVWSPRHDKHKTILLWASTTKQVGHTHKHRTTGVTNALCRQTCHTAKHID